MRKIILNLAISLDGYISDLEGGFEWIVGHGDTSTDTEKTFDFSEFTDTIDTIIMGSIAYEDCVLSGLDTYDNFDLLVATTRTFEPNDGVEFIKGDVCKKVLELKDKEGKDIWLFGGAGLTDTFIKADIVDEYVIGIVPTILGEGRRLFLDNNPKIDLKLTECTVQDGITLLRYIKR